MTVGARSMDSHTIRRRSQDHCQVSPWARHPLIAILSLQLLPEVTLVALR